VRLLPPLSWSTRPVPVKPTTLPPIVKGPGLAVVPVPEPVPDPEPEPEPELELELEVVQAPAAPRGRFLSQLDEPQPTTKTEASKIAVREIFVMGFMLRFAPLMPWATTVDTFDGSP